ncbi:MAG: hypothetical protein AB8I08_29160 [Sandaracinaceae bacterium]
MKKLCLPLSMLALVACSNSIPFEELPNESALISCELLFDCCAEGQRQGYVAESSCVTERTAEVVTTELVASVEAGRIAYDGAAASQCFGMATCTLEDLDPEICNRVYTGLVPAGGACTFGLDCANGPQFCVDGVCAAPAALGETCAGPCVEGAFCSTTSMRCEALPRVGEACPSFRCEDAAFCDMTSQMCEARRANGEACDSLLQCESFSCEDGVCTPRDTGLCGEG